MRLHQSLAALLMALVAAMVFACGDGEKGGNGTSSTATPEPAEDVSGGIYLALGDSIAVGTGASDADRTSYVAVVEDALIARYGDELELRSLANSGDTSQDFIDEQLPAAIDLLEDGDVRVVTITISGNDLEQYGLAPACVDDPSDPACPLEDGLLDVERRLERILSELKAADPHAIIVIQVYPDLFSGTGHELARSAEIAFDLLNGVIVSVAERQDVLIADPRNAFLDHGGELSHILDPRPDFHPNDAGYRAIADAFLEALDLPRDEQED